MNALNVYEFKTQNVKLKDFAIIDVLETGSIGNVFISKYRKTKRIYVLKIVKAKNVNVVTRGYRLSMILNHSNVGKCYGYFYDKINGKKSVICINEYIHGQDLYDSMNNVEFYKTLSCADFCHIFLQISNGLKYIHDNKLVHRDIKLENVIITDDFKIKIIDYDFLILESDAKKEKSCGTASYSSPEMFTGGYNRSTDVWSLGVLFFAVLAKAYPFDGEDNYEIINNIMEKEPDYSYIDDLFVNLIKGMLNKNVSKRLSIDNVIYILNIINKKVKKTCKKRIPNYAKSKKIFMKMSTI